MHALERKARQNYTNFNSTPSNKLPPFPFLSLRNLLIYYKEPHFSPANLQWECGGACLAEHLRRYSGTSDANAFYSARETNQRSDCLPSVSLLSRHLRVSVKEQNGSSLLDWSVAELFSGCPVWLPLFHH